MKTKLIFTILLLFLFTFTQAQSKTYTFMFYNVENLFDVKNDSLHNDDEFTAEGDRRWNYYRLETKLQQTSKVILSAGGWETPVLVGLCEIENRYVLDALCKKTPLQTIGYKIIHKESPDLRGIDVALLYNPKQFYPLNYKYYPLLNKNGEVRRTREILYVSGIIGGKDTLHVFINHWPSRYSGVLETRELRNEAASVLRTQVDVLLTKNTNAKIVIMGDFNDQPTNKSIHDVLQTKEINDTINSNEIYNLSAAWLRSEMGTLKYQSQWFVFDQIIVSGTLLNAKNGLFTKHSWASIHSPNYLLEEDKTHGGLKPKRTYIGFRYNGGFSDHLPVVLKLKCP